MGTEQFKFTVIMAVYNVELFLEEAVASLVNQTIGFDQVQLIMVDDGSSDHSGAICDRFAEQYPDQIISLHQENGGVSAARNAAFPYIRGKYVNFLDSDDCLSEDTLSLVWDFFEKHGNETDIIAIPIYYFEGKTGSHRLNYKFERGSRVIDLQKEWNAVQLSMSSSFVKSSVIRNCCFNTELHYGEDAQLLLRLLLNHQTLGVVSEARYLYRQRTAGAPSALQQSLNDPRHYMPKLRLITEDTITFCKETYGSVPKFIQYALMYDLQWIVRRDDFPTGLFSKEEEYVYLEKLYSLLDSFEDQVILEQQFLTARQKYFLLRKKHGEEPDAVFNENITLYFGDQKIGAFSDNRVFIDFITIKENICQIEGYFAYLPAKDLNISLVAEYFGNNYPCETIPSLRTDLMFGEPVKCLQGFRVGIPLGESKNAEKIAFAAEAMNNRLPLKCDFGWYAPVSNEYRNAYYRRDGWDLVSKDADLYASRASTPRAGKEIKYIWELLTDKQHHHRKAAVIRALYWPRLAVKRKPIWMVSDRRTAAGDNGEAFFRYLRKNHPDLDARFVIRKESGAYVELSKIGKVIENDTIREKLTALVSDYMISSQGELQYINPLYQNRGVFRDLMADKRFVFLQHGIIKDDLSDWLMRPNKNFYGFVTSTKPEYQSILEGNYGYTEKEIWLTGLPRYDRLSERKDPKLITVMPTWRRYLMAGLEKEKMRYSLIQDFEQSEFFRFYHDLLSDPTIIKVCEQYGYQLAFLPHPAFQPYLDHFHDCRKVHFFGVGTDYRSVYSQSALVVTDYSSAIFDAVYLGCPVVYAHFDHEQFFAGEHIYQKGYFDYERDGFGEVEYDLSSTVNRIVEYMQTGCKQKDQYRKRAEQFFAYRDRCNCQRVYDKIVGGEK